MDRKTLDVRKKLPRRFENDHFNSLFEKRHTVLHIWCHLLDNALYVYKIWQGL